MNALLSHRLELAHEAMDKARTSLKFRAANKLRVKPTWVAADSLHLKSGRFKNSTRLRLKKSAELISEYKQNNAPETVAQVQQIAWEARAHRAGNCGEYACIAFDHLYRLKANPINATPIELVAFDRPTDHVFVILGRKRPRGSYIGGLNLSADVVICDPWANIVCSASDYSDRWQLRMMKWETEEKRIVTVPEDDDVPIALVRPSTFAFLNVRTEALEVLVSA